MLLDGCPDLYKAQDDYWQACAGTTGNIDMTECKTQNS